MRILAILLCSVSFAVAGPIDHAELLDSVASGAPLTNDTKALTGRLRALFIDVGQTNGVTVKVSTIADNGTRVARVIYNTTVVTADVQTYPVAQATDTNGTAIANEYVPFILSEDRIRMVTSSGVGTNNSIRAVAVMED